MEVRFASNAAAHEYGALPRSIKIRMDAVLQPLVHWPDVSGAKPLRHGLAGRFRIRTGDYRIQFFDRGTTMIIEKTGHRAGLYED